MPNRPAGNKGVGSAWRVRGVGRMEFQIGTVARSKAGRDKNRFFAVVALEDNFAGIADGRLRKLAHPKRKKLMHLAPTKTVLSPQQMTNDRALYDAISAFRGETTSSAPSA